MAAGLVPLPSYLLSDGTPDGPPRPRLDPSGRAGGTDRLHDWFVAYWPADAATTPSGSGRRTSRAATSASREVTPLTIRDRRPRGVARLDAAVDALGARRRGDHVGRGMLGEAVDGLRADGCCCRRRRTTAPLRRRRPARWRAGPAGPPRTTSSRRCPSCRSAPSGWCCGVRRRATPTTCTPTTAARTSPSHLLHDAFSRPEIDDMLRRRLAEPRDAPRLQPRGRARGARGGRPGDLPQGRRAHDMAEIGWTSSTRTRPGAGIATEAATAMRRPGLRALRRPPARRQPRQPQRALRGPRPAGSGCGSSSTHRLGDYWSKGEWTDSQR